jgi:hypothetical protein
VSLDDLKDAADARLPSLRIGARVRREPARLLTRGVISRREEAQYREQRVIDRDEELPAVVGAL